MELHVGNEWYSFKDSRGYMITQIITRKFVYPDGELYDENTEVKLISANNRVKTIEASELFTDMWKITSTRKADIPAKMEVYPVPNRSRLDRADD
jgi:predicted lipase